MRGGFQCKRNFNRSHRQRHQSALQTNHMRIDTIDDSLHRSYSVLPSSVTRFFDVVIPAKAQACRVLAVPVLRY